MYKWKTAIISLLFLSIIGAAGAQDIVSQRHRATRYHNKFENRKTSSGERFSQKKYTAAHHNIKLGTYVLVVDTITNKWVIVKVNDRCPRRNVIDLAAIAAERIGLTRRKGVSRVFISTLGEGAETLWQQQESMSERCSDSILDMIKTMSKISPPPIVAENKETPPSGGSTAKTTSTAKSTPKETENATQKKQTSAILYISNIDNTDEAEDLLEEMQPSVSQNAKIINDSAEITIEISMKGDIEKFAANFITKYPKYILRIKDEPQK